MLPSSRRDDALSGVAVSLVDTPGTYPWVRDFTADMPIRGLKPAVLEAVAKAGPGGCSALSLGGFSSQRAVA